MVREERREERRGESGEGREETSLANFHTKSYKSIR